MATTVAGLDSVRGEDREHAIRIFGAIIVVDRFYDRAFPESGARGEVRFELPDEGEPRYLIWGGGDCEPAPDLEIDAHERAREETGETQ